MKIFEFIPYNFCYIWNNNAHFHHFSRFIDRKLINLKFGFLNLAIQTQSSVPKEKFMAFPYQI